MLKDHRISSGVKDILKNPWDEVASSVADIVLMSVRTSQAIC